MFVRLRVATSNISKRRKYEGLCGAPGRAEAGRRELDSIPVFLDSSSYPQTQTKKPSLRFEKQAATDPMAKRSVYDSSPGLLLQPQCASFDFGVSASGLAMRLPTL